MSKRKKKTGRPKGSTKLPAQKQVNFRLDAVAADALRQIASREDVSQAELVRGFVKAGLDGWLLQAQSGASGRA